MHDHDHKDHSSSHGDTPAGIKPPKRIRARGTTVGAMSRIMLDILQETAGFSFVPGLVDTAGLALSTLNLVEVSTSSRIILILIAFSERKLRFSPERKHRETGKTFSHSPSSVQLSFVSSNTRLINFEESTRFLQSCRRT